jgi:hypothetical protein
MRNDGSLRGGLRLKEGSVEVCLRQTKERRRIAPAPLSASKMDVIRSQSTLLAPHQSQPREGQTEQRHSRAPVWHSVELNVVDESA